MEVKKDSFFYEISPLAETTIIENYNGISQFYPKNKFPLTLTLPETLMTSWSFRSGMFEYDLPKEHKDLSPSAGSFTEDNLNSDGTKYWRQDYSYRKSLYNDFFNARE